MSRSIIKHLLLAVLIYVDQLLHWNLFNSAVICPTHSLTHPVLFEYTAYQRARDMILPFDILHVVPRTHVSFMSPLCAMSPWCAMSLFSTSTPMSPVSTSTAWYKSFLLIDVDRRRCRCMQGQDMGACVWCVHVHILKEKTSVCVCVCVMWYVDADVYLCVCVCVCGRCRRTQREDMRAYASQLSLLL